MTGSDDFTLCLWEPSVSKHPVARMTGHQQFFRWISLVYSFFDTVDSCRANDIRVEAEKCDKKSVEKVDILR